MTQRDELLALADLADDIEQSDGIVLILTGATKQIGIKATAQVIAALRLAASPSSGAVREDIPAQITGELACILEDCGPPEMQSPEALATLIEQYQPTWARIAAALAQTEAPSEATPAPATAFVCPACGARGTTDGKSSTVRQPAPADDAAVAWPEAVIEPIEAAAQRFYIDHGMIHDRATGKHVTTEGEPPFEDGIEQVCELLNGLVRRPAASGDLRTAEQVFTDICDELGCAYDNEAALEAIAKLKAASLPGRDEEAKRLLNGRDDFIVSKGLWSEFLDHLIAADKARSLKTESGS